MDKSNRHDKFLKLRDEFPFFVYEGYDYRYSDNGLDISFHFNISGRFHFSPSTFIPHKDFFIPGQQIMVLLPDFIFHLGLIELISYWKATCSPRVIIRPHALTPPQVEWWKKCWFNGLGEFFFLNSIYPDPEDFMQVESASDSLHAPVGRQFNDGTIVPVGGGKDSVVTLEILRRLPGVTPMILNPRGASVHSIFMAGFTHSEMIGINRTVDPLLLRLNDEGFLNGHTPFSALLAFQSLIASVMTGKKYIALSNESSANEATVPGSEINHQYSKTYGFERDFREYTAEWLCPDISYFSILRPLNELQITRLFTRHPGYFNVFKSCNAGSKTDSWCCRCPKCLFTCIMLAPFLKPGQLCGIFGQDILNDNSLKPVFDQLIGIAPVKPFECVGTVTEVNAALRETISMYKTGTLPALLEYYRDLASASSPDSPLHQFPSFTSLLASWDPHHFLPEQYETLLKGALYA